MARLPFSAAPGQSLGMGGDMGALDPNAYVEPMELYDSIFWGESNMAPLGKSRRTKPASLTSPIAESPDPWNSGVDAMSFDFLAQPPPGQPSQQQFYF